MTVFNLERARKLEARKSNKEGKKAIKSQNEAEEKKEKYHNSGKNYPSKPIGFKPERERKDKLLAHRYTLEDHIMAKAERSAEIRLMQSLKQEKRLARNRQKRADMRNKRNQSRLPRMANSFLSR